MAVWESPRAATRAITRLSIFGVFAVSLIVVAGWVIDMPILRSFIPGRIDMKLLTCAASIAGGTALARIGGRSRRRRSTIALIVGVTALSLLSIVEYVLSRDFRVLSLLSPDLALDSETIHAGRMAPNTAAAFLLLAVAWVLLALRRRRFVSVMIISLAGSGLIALLPVTGYLYGADELRGLRAFSPMALPTAITLLLLTIGTVGQAGSSRFIPLLISSGPGGMTLRRLLPAAVMVPLVLGWIRLIGQRGGLYGTEFGAAVFSVSIAIVLITLAALTAWLLEQEDLRRRAGDEMIRDVARVQQEIVTATRSPQSIMDLIAKRSRELTRADGSVVEIAQGESMVYRAVDGLAASFRGMEISIAGSVSGLAYRTGKTVRCDDTEHDERVDRAACRSVGARSMVVVPLSHGESSIGVLKVYSARPHAFSTAQEHMLEMMAGLLAAVLSFSHEFEYRGAAIAEQAAEIVDLRSRFESFVERSPAIAFMKDQDGYYLYANAAFHRAAGDADRSILGRTDESWLPAQAAGEIRRRDQEAFGRAGGSTAVDEFLINGETRWWMVFRFPLSAGIEGVLGGVAIDITEQRRAEEEIRRLNLELEQRVQARTEELRLANEQLESFSYSVSHDLRTPLRAIDGYSRMLEEDYASALDAEGNRLLGVIRTNTSRMGHLIGDLLEFSRFSRSSVRPVSTDISALARAVAKRLLAAEGGGRSIELSIEDAPPAVVDPSMFEQVLTNLLSNAIKYTRDRVSARIQFRGWRDDGWLVYGVEDNGVGFDPKYKGKLFGVFQRLHHTEEFEGTGVGLAIVRRVVERHGGRVWAEGELGKGARFFVALPAPPDEAFPGESGRIGDQEV